MHVFGKKEESPGVLQLNQEEKRCIDALLVASKLKQEEKQIAYAKYFKELGDIFAQRGELLQDTRQQLKAVAIYNLVLASQLPQPQANRLYEDRPILFSSLNEIQIRLVEKIKQIEDKLIQLFGSQVPKQTIEKYWQHVEDVKSILNHIRLRAQKELALVEKKEITVQAIYQHIADELKQELLTKLIEKCFQVLPLPLDCIYSIIALGSLARSEATPFSDFEFAILIEDQGEKRNKIHKEYFRRFTHLLWIKVLNLRETTTRMMNISFLDWMPKNERVFYQNKLLQIEWLDEKWSPCKKGFSFDGQMEGGCHTPLGNRHHTMVKIHEIEENNLLSLEEKNKEIKKIYENEYELIGTPIELSKFQTDESFKRKHALTTVMSTVALILSNDHECWSSLEKIYEEEVAKILNKSIAGTDKTCIQKRSLNLLTESCEKFKFRGGKFEEEYHYFDAKYHLYRLPNMLLDHLTAYFGVSGKNLWERITNLFGKNGKIPNEMGAKYLIQTVSFILTIRLTSYLKKGYRDDRVIMFDRANSMTNEKLLEKYLGVDKKALFEIYYVLIPFHMVIESFIHKKGAIAGLKQTTFYDNSFFVRGEIYLLLLDYKNAIESLKSYIKEKQNEILIDPHSEKSIIIANALNSLGIAYREQSHLLEAKDEFEKAKKIYNALHETSLAAEVLISLGIIYTDLDHYDDAINTLEKAKRVFIKEYDYKHQHVALSLFNLGRVYRKQSCFEKAIGAYKEAQEILILLYGEHHESVALVFNNLGTAYQEQGKYTEAISNLEKSINIKTNLYGNSHITVANTKVNLGSVYVARYDNEKAIVEYEEAKRIYRQILQGANHVLFAVLLNNLGIIYQQQKLYDKAKAELDEAKRIYVALHGYRHSSIAQVLNNLGNIERVKGNYNQAIRIFKNSLKIELLLYGENHIAVAKTLNGLGLVYEDQYLYEKALNTFRRSVEIILKVVGKYNLSAAESLINIGNINRQQSHCNKALEAYQKAEQIVAKQLGSRCDKFACIHLNTGKVYIEQGEFEKARNAFERCMGIFTKSSQNYEEALKYWSFSYIREGNRLFLKGKSDAAEVFYQKAGMKIPIEEKQLSLTVNSPVVHRELANIFYQNKDMSAVYEHYQILLKLVPNNPEINIQLGCITHILAQIKNSTPEKENYLKYLKEAHDYFKKAMNLNANVVSLTQFAHFMLRNHSKFKREDIIDCLRRAIDTQLNFEVDLEELNYGMMGRLTVDRILHELIDKEKEISFRAYYLVYYLLVQAYILNHQITEAKQTLITFGQEIVKYKQVYQNIQKQIYPQNEFKIAQISDCLNEQELEKEFRLLDALLLFSQHIMQILMSNRNILTIQDEQYIRLGHDKWIARTSDGEKYFVFQNNVVSFKVYIYSCYAYYIANLFSNRALEAQRILSSLQNEVLQIKEAAHRRKLILKLQVLPDEVQQILQKIVKREKEERELIEMILEASMPATSILYNFYQANETEQKLTAEASKSPSGQVKRDDTSKAVPIIFPFQSKVIPKDSAFSPFWQINSHLSREALHAENQVKTWLLGKIPSQFHLGKAMSKGDCFFDAIAQGLNQLSGKEEYDTKSLRLQCDTYVKDTRNSWVKEANKSDREDHEQYLVRIQFTAQEIEEKERQGIKLGTAVWGRPKIEGRIFCEQFNSRLHVIEIQEDGSIHRFLVDKEGENEEVNPEVDYNDLRIIHLVNYHNHYVPLLQCSGLITQLQEEVMQKQPAISKQGETTKVPLPSAHTNLFGTQASYCQVNSAIVGKIFRFFDTNTLKSVKLVNKQWYKVVQELEEKNATMRSSCN